MFVYELHLTAHLKLNFQVFASSFRSSIRDGISALKLQTRCLKPASAYKELVLLKAAAWNSPTEKLQRVISYTLQPTTTNSISVTVSDQPKCSPYRQPTPPLVPAAAETRRCCSSGAGTGTRSRVLRDTALAASPPPPFPARALMCSRCTRSARFMASASLTDATAIVKAR